VGSALPLVLPSVNSEGAGNLLNHANGHRVKAAQGLGNNQDEGEPFLPAQLLGTLHLPVVCDTHGVARGDSCPGPGGVLHGVGDSDIYRCVAASDLLRKKDVARLAGIAREQALLLLGLEEACGCRRVRTARHAAHCA
jgi:hypothetical protein